MKLVTACPACSTQFFVSHEQLNANHGKVRCGQCNHVFNAHATLTEIATDAQDTVDATQDELVDATEQAHEVSLPEVHIPDEEQPDNPLVNDATVVAEQLIETPDAEPTSIEEVLVEEPDADQSTDETSTIEEEILDIAATPILASAATEEESIETDTPPIADYFAGSAKLKLRPIKKSPRWLMVLLMTVLLLLAIVQALYYLRTTIASQLPQTKSYLVQACKLLGCKVALPSQLESLAIDDSEMREDADHDHVLLFSITLINKANIALRYPSIELTLTDANDETVIRRTFTPNNYLTLNHGAHDSAVASNVEAGFAAKDRLHIKLALNTNNIVVAGYRLELVE